jgi:diphosphomevalonate decarboxylase
LPNAELTREQVLKLKLRITSVNNFATASGLASSSSGLSCLSFALAQLYGVEEAFEREYTKFARLGSGSACRSIYGGFVEWQRGFKAIEEIKADVEEVSNKSVAVPV